MSTDHITKYHRGPDGEYARKWAVTHDNLDALIDRLRADAHNETGQAGMYARDLLTTLGLPYVPQQPDMDESVWFAVVRRRLDFHAINQTEGTTECGRSTVASGQVGSRRYAHSSGMLPCPRCWPPTATVEES